MNTPQDELDQLLNDALAGYSNVEPRPGIEQRILRHVRTASAPRRAWWPWAAAAVPVLACLWLLAVNRQLPVEPPAGPTLVLPPAPPVIARVIPPVAVPEHPVRVRRRHEAFPRPAPLSPEERALVALVTQFPEQARQLTAPSEPQPIEPLEIPKLEIPPLDGDIPSK